MSVYQNQNLTSCGCRLVPRGGVVVIGTLLSDKIPILLSSVHRYCVKSQLLFGVRIELVVGFLPNPRQSSLELRLSG